MKLPWKVLNKHERKENENGNDVTDKYGKLFSLNETHEMIYTEKNKWRNIDFGGGYPCYKNGERNLAE